jgi:hypothetical protein
VLIAPVSKANSLLTGNFTGKFAISGLRDAPLKPKVAAIQRLLGQFPTGVNREDILKNREGFGGYHGIQLLQSYRHPDTRTNSSADRDKRKLLKIAGGCTIIYLLDGASLRSPHEDAGGIQ